MFNQLRQALPVFRACAALLLGMSSMKATAANAKLYEMLGPEFRLSNAEAQNLHEEAEALYYQGDYQPAFACIEKALKMAETAPNREDRDVANLLTTLAEGHLILGNPVQASNFLTRALAVGERALGTNHPVVGRTLGDLAAAIFILGDRPNAKRTLDRSLGIYARHYGTNHVSYAMAQSLLALILMAEGKPAEAADRLDAGSRIIGREIGTNTYQFAMNLFLRGVVAMNRANYPAPAIPIMPDGVGRGRVQRGRERGWQRSAGVVTRL